MRDLNLPMTKQNKKRNLHIDKEYKDTKKDHYFTGWVIIYCVVNFSHL